MFRAFSARRRKDFLPIVLGLFDEPLAEEGLGHALKGFVLALEEVDFVIQTAQAPPRWLLAPQVAEDWNKIRNRVKWSMCYQLGIRPSLFVFPEAGFNYEETKIGQLGHLIRTSISFPIETQCIAGVFSQEPCRLFNRFKMSEYDVEQGNISILKSAFPHSRKGVTGTKLSYKLVLIWFGGVPCQFFELSSRFCKTVESGVYRVVSNSRNSTSLRLNAVHRYGFCRG